MNNAATTLAQVRERQLSAMRLTCMVLGHILAPVSEEAAHDKRDGEDGWSVVEIVCHLRDFDGIFHDRARLMLAEESPQLPAYDHEAMAIDRGYQGETVADAYQQLRRSREGFIAFFESLTEAQWQRAGIHPEKGAFTMTDALMQAPAHDLDHIEQITRVLAG